MSACETFPDGLPRPLDTGATDRYWRWKLQDSSDLNQFLPTLVDELLERFWRNAVRKYTSCKLTYGSDKLIAIWGIASFLISALRETYGVGLWERNLEEQLAWRVIHGQQDHAQPARRSYHWRAPSWSWASMDAIIDLPDRFATVRDYQVVGHDGKPIAFVLAGEQQKSSKTAGPPRWKEQLNEYAFRLKKLDELRKMENSRSKDASVILPQPCAGIDSSPSPIPDLSQPSGDTNTKFSPIPDLSQPSIPIWGHIGQAVLLRAVSGIDWTMSFFNQPDGIVVEAVPDVEPEDSHIRSQHTDFLVLAMNKDYGEVLPAQEVHTKAMTYSGIGLLIEHVGTPGVFCRKGSFRFSRCPLASMQLSFYSPASKFDHQDGSEFGIQGEYNEEKGYQIWLI
jgi:hypothetical protein